MFEALGRVMYRRRRWVVALSVAFVVFAGVWGTGVFGAMTGGGGGRSLGRGPRTWRLPCYRRLQVNGVR